MVAFMCARQAAVSWGVKVCAASSACQQLRFYTVCTNAQDLQRGCWSTQVLLGQASALEQTATMHSAQWLTECHNAQRSMARPNACMHACMYVCKEGCIDKTSCCMIGCSAVGQGNIYLTCTPFFYPYSSWSATPLVHQTSQPLHL